MYLGLDLGTSGLKALIIDAQQHIIGSAHAALNAQRPHPGWSEQHPADWISACEQVFDQLQASYPQALAQVRGISLSGQMHGATLLDNSGTPLRPCILWNDTRSHVEAAELDAMAGVRELSGNIVFPGFTAPKLMWVARHEPDIFNKVSKVLLPKDYLRYWLTGDYVSEMSDAAGTAWLDVANRCWSDTLLNASGMRREQMPELVEGSQASGEIRTELAQRWGIGKAQAQYVVVGGGAGDNAASACGMGVVQPGEAFLSLGTSGVLFAANECFKPNPESAVHAFCHAIPNSWHQMGVILSATDALNWYAGIAGKSAAELDAQLQAAQGSQPTHPADVTFLPYLAGERTPHNDARIRGSFLGLSHNSDQNQLTQAVLEGVAYAMRDNLEALRQAGTELQRIKVVGGGSRSHYWLNVIANVLNLPVDIPADGDFGGAFGAARLALLAADGGDPFEVCAAPAVQHTIEPNHSLAAHYEDGYQRYRSAYPLIKQLGEI
ncbi:xylulokinase [Oceanobacter kriegii]|uniref:xylulokinase n=1 Tax=Oceanobacter kriegii TaxID=64972 RepID=UPI00041F9994|nr:xylulokinase [Oceanobacter kriegii]